MGSEEKTLSASQPGTMFLGLGEPPVPYYTNDSELCNAMIKLAVQFKENKIYKFVHEMSGLLQQRKNDAKAM